MKRNFTILLAVCFVVVTKAQPIGGYLGKRFLTTISMELVPGLQQYEVNLTTFGAWEGTDTYRNYTPRTFIATEYQYKRKAAVVGSLGYARLQVPYDSYQQNLFDQDVVTQPMNAVFLQFQNKHGLRGRSIAYASSYIAYGLNIAFLKTTRDVTIRSYYANVDEIEMLANSTSLISFNLEWGRRMIFDHGWLLDFSIAMNLSPSTFKMVTASNQYGSNESYFEYDPEIVKSNMKLRAAVNSIFNFKISVGKFF